MKEKKDLAIPMSYTATTSSTRRDFLRNSALAGAAGLASAALGAVPARAADRILKTPGSLRRIRYAAEN